MMNRRGFLGAILAAGCAPAIVRAESLMRCTGIVLPTLAETLVVNTPARFTVLDPQMIIREAMGMLGQNIEMGSQINAGFKELNVMISDWGPILDGLKPGDTFTIEGVNMIKVGR